MNAHILATFSAALASASQAQTSAWMDLRVSVDAWVWVDHADVAPGTRVHVGMFIGWEGGGSGLAGAVYQVRGEGGNLSDSIDISSPGLGRQGTFNFGAATQAVFGDATGFRIDDANDLANERRFGIATAQNTPGNLLELFRVENPAFVYAFDVVIGADGSMRTIGLEAPLDQLKGVPSDTAHGVIGIYSDRNATRGTNVTDVTTDGASITVVPAPGAALSVLGGVAFARRRRGVTGSERGARRLWRSA